MVEERRGGNVEDLEIRAMATVGEVLAGLDEAAASRVLRWASDRYLAGSVNVKSLRGPAVALARPSPGDDQGFTDLPSLFHAANPVTLGEKVLVAGYWFQEVAGQSDLDAQQINAELKQLGHRILNITMAFGELMNRKPQLAIQTRKSGSSKQARKKYRLTREGVSRVKAMLRGEAPNGE